MIDTLMYVKRLEAIGISREQAELQVQVMAEIVDSNYATKQDFRDLKTEMDHKFEQLENRLTIKLGSIMIFGMSALATLFKFF